MTNARHPIGRWAQTRWFFRHYRPALRDHSFRIYLFSEGRNHVGYGALKLERDELLITECVAPEYRGRGVGKAILAELIAVARQEGRHLVAEIWASNLPSIRLHEAAGFALEDTIDRQGSDLRIYTLRGS